MFTGAARARRAPVARRPRAGGALRLWSRSRIQSALRGLISVIPSSSNRSARTVAQQPVLRLLVGQRRRREPLGAEEHRQGLVDVGPVSAAVVIEVGQYPPR